MDEESLRRFAIVYDTGQSSAIEEDAAFRDRDGTRLVVLTKQHAIY